MEPALNEQEESMPFIFNNDDTTMWFRVDKGSFLRHSRPDFQGPPVAPSPPYPNTVRHSYSDHALDPFHVRDEGLSHRELHRFPSVLHKLLGQADEHKFDDIISWQSHGRAFRIHSPGRLHKVIQRFFGPIKLGTFQRQLSMYGFKRLYQKTADHYAYYHERFLRGRLDLTYTIMRVPRNGRGVRQTADPSNEPQFHCMPPMPSTEVGTNQPYSSSLNQGNYCTVDVAPVLAQAAVEGQSKPKEYNSGAIEDSLSSFLLSDTVWEDELEPFPFQDHVPLKMRLDLQDPGVTVILEGCLKIGTEDE